MTWRSSGSTPTPTWAPVRPPIPASTPWSSPALTGQGDQELLQIQPATTTADRVALVGMHDWTDPMLPAIADQWGLRVFSPDTLRSSSAPLLDWLGDTGTTKVAIHFDVDTIDADEVQLGLGADLGGLSTAEARRVVADIDGAAEVIALTIAEFIPRQVMQLQQILAGFPGSSQLRV